MFWRRNIFGRRVCRLTPRRERIRRAEFLAPPCGRLRTRPSGGKPPPSKCLTGWPVHGPIGVGRVAILPLKKMPAPILTRCAICWRLNAPLRTQPQWFNTGLHWSYGIDGPAQGHHYVDYKTGKLTKSDSSYEHPQPHACFIQSVSDDLVNDGGIMDLWVREARLFKYGSGTGTNFSSLRGAGENLSGGGKSSGLMGFLKIGDRAAGAIKSGGTTRRAAKMVICDADHP